MIPIKQMLGQISPLLGSLLSGSLSVGTGQLLGKILLGKESASSADIEKALSDPTPTQLAALKKIEADLQIRLAEFTVEEEKLALQDRENARLRETQMRDRIPAILAVLLTVGFFGIMFSLMFFSITTEAHQVIDVMLGALGTAWISCISYYFGSSHGSQIKSQLLLNR